MGVWVGTIWICANTLMEIKTRKERRKKKVLHTRIDTHIKHVASRVRIGGGVGRDREERDINRTYTFLFFFSTQRERAKYFTNFFFIIIKKGRKKPAWNLPTRAFIPVCTSSRTVAKIQINYMRYNRRFELRMHDRSAWKNEQQNG